MKKKMQNNDISASTFSVMFSRKLPDTNQAKAELNVSELNV